MFHELKNKEIIDLTDSVERLRLCQYRLWKHVGFGIPESVAWIDFTYACNGNSFHCTNWTQIVICYQPWGRQRHLFGRSTTQQCWTAVGTLGWGEQGEVLLCSSSLASLRAGLIFCFIGSSVCLPVFCDTWYMKTKVLQILGWSN